MHVSSPRQYIAARKASKRIIAQHHPDVPVIVSDRPIPVETRGGLRKFDHFYPFEEMKPGDSFWVPTHGSTSICTKGAVSRFAKKSGWKFITRSQSEDGRANSLICNHSRPKYAGIRIWRIK